MINIIFNTFLFKVLQILIKRSFLHKELYLNRLKKIDSKNFELELWSFLTLLSIYLILKIRRFP